MCWDCSELMEQMWKSLGHLSFAASSSTSSFPFLQWGKQGCSPLLHSLDPLFILHPGCSPTGLWDDPIPWPRSGSGGWAAVPECPLLVPFLDWLDCPSLAHLQPYKQTPLDFILPPPSHVMLSTAPAAVQAEKRAACHLVSAAFTAPQRSQHGEKGGTGRWEARAWLHTCGWVGVRCMRCSRRALLRRCVRDSQGLSGCVPNSVGGKVLLSLLCSQRQGSQRRGAWGWGGVRSLSGGLVPFGWLSLWWERGSGHFKWISTRLGQSILAADLLQCACLHSSSWIFLLRSQRSFCALIAPIWNYEASRNGWNPSAWSQDSHIQTCQETPRLC